MSYNQKMEDMGNYHLILTHSTGNVAGKEIYCHTQCLRNFYYKFKPKKAQIKS